MKPRMYVRGEMQINYLKYYRLVRKYFCRVHDLSDGELELIMYLDDLEFTQKDFENGNLTVTWDRGRWKKFVDEGWFTKFRDRCYKTNQGSRWKTSIKAHKLVMQIYRILCGEEEIANTKRYNPLIGSERYADKRLLKSIDMMRDDMRKKKKL